ncbi:hypothetical protein ES695_20015 [Candidatus Atribacteria bacterium 1244-E10-H5-B2]|nr:MAG: hypothetical protein ES695_20015 [Candidatus Atribacteria bacterium 1244-E10-H5-B2]
MKKLNKIHLSFRLSEELVKKIDEFAEKLELVYIDPLIRNQGYRSVAIRLALEDTMLRFFGPKDDPDEIISPYYNEMSKIIPVLKNIRLRGKLEDLTGDNQEEIDKIIKEFA